MMIWTKTVKFIVVTVITLACASVSYILLNSKDMKLDQKIIMKTTSGCSFSVEKGWTVTQDDEIVKLQEPDKELTIYFLENSEQNSDDAITAAWKKIAPDFNRTIQNRIVGVPADGWDEIVQLVYEVSTEEKRTLLAIARRIKTTWYITLIDGTQSAVQRRGAGINLAVTGFKVPGMKEESFAGKHAHKLDDTRLTEFMDFVEQARIACEIPGVAIGLVQNGKLISSQAFGVKELDKDEPVVVDTLFMIGSTTKSLTTLMMAKLIDEKYFDWETPVRKVMPTFELGNQKTTNQLLMKHFVAANTGMPRHDVELAFNMDKATPELRMQEMKKMEPTTGFGETFQYSNSMVMAGGYIAAHCAYPDLELGLAYDKAMQTRVFDPLQMSSSTFDFKKLKNFACPYGRNLDGTLSAIPLVFEECLIATRPSGALWSNVHDVAQYIIMELQNGVNEQGQRVISEFNLLKRRQPQIMIADTLSYGLGLMIMDDHGVQVITHGGNTSGFTSEMLFLPEHQIGMVLLTNAGGANLFRKVVQRKLMEVLFDGTDIAQAKLVIGCEQEKNNYKNEMKNVELYPEISWIEKFLGSYIHPVLGQISIVKQGDVFVFDTGIWTAQLGQKKEEDGTLLLMIVTPPFFMECLPKYDEQGNVVKLIFDDSQHEYIFERQQ